MSKTTAVMIALHHRATRLELEPHLGGSVRSMSWQGLDLLRTQIGGQVLTSASFPLVPFCNRIAGSAFSFDGRTITLAPNHPSAPQEPVLHGSGWLRPWHVEAHTATSASLLYRHDPGEWPWRYDACQTFDLSGDGVTMALSIVNKDSRDMPVGLGFHPFFPRDAATFVYALHCGERQADGRLKTLSEPTNWWRNAPVDSRIVDTAYTGRAGDIRIEWPDRGVGVRLEPSPNLPFTQYYVPAGEDFFCVEPVSHLPEAFHTREPASGWRAIAPGETFDVSMKVTAYSLPIP